MSSAAELLQEEQPELELDLDRTIFRHPKGPEHPYLMIAKETIRDSGISLAARGLLAFMLSQPDDWDFNVRHLATNAGVNKDTVAKILRELMDAGYVSRQACRVLGKYRTRYLVYEHPTLREIPGAQAESPVRKSRTGGSPVRKSRTGGSPVRIHLSGDTGPVNTCPVEPDILNTLETKDRETEEEPPASPTVKEPAQDGHLPDHMQLATAWYKALAKRTCRLIKPSGEDFLAAQKAVERADLETLLGLIEPYFAGDWWFTKHKATKKPTYSFGVFLKRFPEMLAAEPTKGPAPPRGERKCPACGRAMYFGTGRFCVCDCKKAWEIGDDGELEDVSREGS